jgi:anti-sigma regulatory factor (Ser/Thr protein kinase)/anti-anti-sigma regulatory factor
VPLEASRESLAAFTELVNGYLENKPETIIVDCSPLELVTSSHVRVLWQIHQSSSDSGVKLQLRSPSLGLIRVLKVLDLYEFFAYEKDFLIPQLRKAVQREQAGSAKVFVHEFNANSVSINEAIDHFLSFLKDVGIPDMTVFELKTTFYEVATNIRLHGEMDDNESVVVSATADNSKVVLAFADSGKAFNLTTHETAFDPHSAAKNGQATGLGIAMVRRLNDKISYSRLYDVINVLVIEKQWS